MGEASRRHEHERGGKGRETPSSFAVRPHCGITTCTDGIEKFVDRKSLIVQVVLHDTPQLVAPDLWVMVRGSDLHRVIPPGSNQ